jgi:hypothetical protein
MADAKVNKPFESAKRGAAAVANATRGFVSKKEYRRNGKEAVREIIFYS